jgi:hypothetical protein
MQTSIIRQLDIHALIGSSNSYIKSLTYSIEKIFNNLSVQENEYCIIYAYSGSPIFVYDNVSILYDGNIIMKQLKAPYNLTMYEVNDIILSSFKKKLKITAIVTYEYGDLKQYFDIHK